MKLRQIHFVVEIAQSGSFSEAAARCNVTQPTLSNGLAQLEAELRGKLFARTTRKVELTPFGRHMLPFLHAVHKAQEEATAAAESFHNPSRKLLRIGISPLVDMRMVTLITEPFRRAHFGLEVFFKECLLDDLAARLSAGAIDLAILPRDIVPEDLERAEFYADPLFYLPCHHPSEAPHGPMSVAEVPDDPIIMTAGGCGLNRSLEVIFDAEGRTCPAYPGYAINYAVIEEWTWLGLGAGVLPRAKLLNSNGSAVPLITKSGRPAEFTFYWAWRREVRDLPHIAAFLDHLRVAGPRLVSGQGRQVAV